MTITAVVIIVGGWAIYAMPFRIMQTSSRAWALTDGVVMFMATEHRPPEDWGELEPHLRELSRSHGFSSTDELRKEFAVDFKAWEDYRCPAGVLATDFHSWTEQNYREDLKVITSKSHLPILVNPEKILTECNQRVTWAYCCYCD